MAPGLIFALFIAAFIGIAVFGWLQAKKRREAFAAFAAQHGLSFDHKKDHDVDNLYADFKCLRRGSNRYGHNQMHGEWRGRGFHGFDYHYQVTSGSGKNRSTHHYHFSVIVIEAGHTLKPLYLRPENVMDKLASFVGFDDIDFEWAEFSRAFMVKAEDKRWAYDFMQRPTMELLMRFPKSHFEIDWARVMYWNDKRWDPEEFATHADLVCDMLDGLPAYARENLEKVWKET